jgi:N-acetylglucosamine malate deacetylase 1
MATNNPYQALVEGFARLLSQGQALSPAGLIPPERPPATADVPSTLIFAPHPDDEVIIGGLPLRLLREQKLNVINVAVTLGTRPERQAERWQELKNCGGCLPRPTGTFCHPIHFFCLTDEQRVFR